MFKIAQTPSYFAPVEVNIPGVSGKQTFDVEFKRLTRPEIAALQERIAADATSSRDICHELVIGWKGVQGEAGELEFSVTNLDAVLDIHPVEQSVIAAFFASITGARLKN